MAKYLLAYHGGRVAETDDERNKQLAAWGEWFQRAGGSFTDPGNPVGQSRIVSDGTVAQGGGANPISGYSVLEADSIDNAVELAKGCPVLLSGGSVEVAETFDVM